MPRKLQDELSWEELCEHTLNKIGHKLKLSEIQIFRNWFAERESVGYLFDPTMILRCFRIWQDLQKGLDHFVVISGREGFGKTTLSFQIAAWVNPQGFTIKNVCYGAKQYLDILSKKADEYVKEIEDEKKQNKE